jgi:hypothetical protein
VVGGAGDGDRGDAARGYQRERVADCYGEEEDSVKTTASYEKHDGDLRAKVELLEDGEHHCVRMTFTYRCATAAEATASYAETAAQFSGEVGAIVAAAGWGK